GVVWLLREDDPRSEQDYLWWNHGTVAMNFVKGRPRGPEARARANWEPATIDPGTGLVSMGTRGQGIACYWFKAEVPPDEQHRYPAMPQRCPSCHIDYSDRLGR